MKWSDLIGKKIVAFRGHQGVRFDREKVTIDAILFDDCATFLRLREQDAYDYHDCCGSARILALHADESEWKKLYNEEDGYLESTLDTCDPF